LFTVAPVDCLAKATTKPSLVDETNGRLASSFFTAKVSNALVSTIRFICVDGSAAGSCRPIRINAPQKVREILEQEGKD
jgi:hypothetical protein